ncbi:MAG: hypothetical protein CM1200mP15_17620 [Dehalococcoidia bacterium]|nr:MAG: hypothetical protein CM1200mP15_17620 [Dehalococcoidia bacterium]
MTSVQDLPQVNGVKKYLSLKDILQDIGRAKAVNQHW